MQSGPTVGRTRLLACPGNCRVQACDCVLSRDKDKALRVRSGPTVGDVSADVVPRQLVGERKPVTVHA
jgi:hypothetical protein